MEKKKLWQKEVQVNKRVEAFTVGRDLEFDLELAPFDVLGSLAHINMLSATGLLEKNEEAALAAGLRGIYRDIAAGRFAIEPGVEDIHSMVELLLTRHVGESGKKIHAARSRNDQVLVDLKLYVREKLWQVAQAAKTLQGQFLGQATRHQDVLLPGYTHTQVAMPSSFGLWLGAYAESLADDLTVLWGAYQVADKNPLGSAAGYGSSFPIDRALTTRLLGFARPDYNVVYAQMGRGKTEFVAASALAVMAGTLGRFAADCCLYLSQNFAFISFPDELTTGSSIMPHKKNPDVFELVRAKCNQLLAVPNQVAMLCNNLSSGYHRDYQLLKEMLFPAFDTLLSCADILGLMLENLSVSQNILDDEKYRYLFSVEEVNRLALAGMPFRDAYKAVGQQIAEGRFKPAKTVAHTHLGSIGNPCLAEARQAFEEVYAQFDAAQARASKAIEGLLGS